MGSCGDQVVAFDEVPAAEGGEGADEGDQVDALTARQRCCADSMLRSPCFDDL
jgi:hypothetical protein